MKKKAFSLVELSIVLVILGLLVGGILAGQSLIRASELRSVASSTDKVRTAVSAFRGKYFGYPGDLSNAVKFWGAAAGGLSDGPDAACMALDATNPSTGTATCNGNGNGFILAFQSGLAIAARPERYETFRAWQQLANAGLIEGQYTGVQGDQGLIDHVIGSNVPGLAVANGGMSLYQPSPGEGSYTYRNGNFGNTLTVGAAKRPSDTSGKLFTPGELWNIDTKLDDGKPGTGPMRAFRISLCATSAAITDGLTAEYLLSSDLRDCTFLMTNL